MHGVLDASSRSDDWVATSVIQNDSKFAYHFPVQKEVSWKCMIPRPGRLSVEAIWGNPKQSCEAISTYPLLFSEIDAAII